MNTHKISNKDWRLVEERFQKKLSSWKGKLLSIGGSKASFVRFGII